MTPATNTTRSRPIPEFIIVVFRHETPFYDDSYAVNTANIGPYGDALNDELIPYIDQNFNTIPAPYARIQEGGSTGGWESIASLVFRPDLFGVCFTSYPVSHEGCSVSCKPYWCRILMFLGLSGLSSTSSYTTLH